MDTSRLAHPKPRPAALLRQDKRKALAARDAAESAKVKQRSGGICECVIDGTRCWRRAAQVHHLLGGFGVRGRGRSVLAAEKVHACARCHTEIHAHVLLPLGGRRFQRVR